MTIGNPSGRLTGRLAPFFPLPLVGASVLLAILIFLTPNLLSTGSPSAGSIESQVELLVDRAPAGDNFTHLYVRGFGLARYASLTLAVGSLNGTAFPATLSGVRWTIRDHGNNSLELDTRTSDPSFAVNASASFVDSAGVGIVYRGGYAFRWEGDRLLSQGYDDASGSTTTALASLPLVLLLPENPTGGGP